MFFAFSILFVSIFLLDFKVVEFNGKLKEIAKKIPGNFIQIHQSYLINFDYIKNVLMNSVEMKNERYNSNQPVISEISEKATGGTCVEGQRVNVCVDNYIKHESFAYIYNLSLYEVVLLDRY
ncbi:MAG: LytTR family DNA-binding domain-containing protein [Blautia wexlerae]